MKNQASIFLFALLVLVHSNFIFAGDTVNHLIINADQGKYRINKNIYGHFSEHLGRCIYEGYWVGEDSPIPNTRGIRKDVVEALKKIKIPVLRWPGGCFADEYHWMDGIGLRQDRPTMINTHWGGVTENNHFGTHEFMDLCEQLGAEPYICANLGSATVQEMQQWVEYLTFDGISPMADLRRKNGRAAPWKVKYWGIGNENWGCGGHMRVEYYTDLYRRYATYARNFSGNRLTKIACGAGDVFSNIEKDLHWTEVLVREAGRFMDDLSIHYYTVVGSWRNKGSATEFGEKAWFLALEKAMYIEELIIKHSNIMDHYDPEKRIGLIVDEWGIWHDVEPNTNPGFLYQQNTLRDAFVAAITLNIFNRHSDRVRMANIAQTVNVLQAMILTKAKQMLLTPTYHVFDMYKVHQDAWLLPIDLKCSDYQFENEKIPSLNCSASRDNSGKIHISLCNPNPQHEAKFECELRGFKPTKISGRMLTAETMNAHNTFEQTEALKPTRFENVRLNTNGFTGILPPMAIVVLEIE